MFSTHYSNKDTTALTAYSFVPLLLQCRTPYAGVHTLVLLMMGTMMPETCWDKSLIINNRLVASCWSLSLFALRLTSVFPPQQWARRKCLIQWHISPLFHINGTSHLCFQFPPPPMPPHVLCGLCGPPCWAWQECNRLLRLGRPWGVVTLSRWGVSGDRGCSAKRGLKPKVY